MRIGLLIAIAACGRVNFDPGLDVPSWEGGTRLRPRVWVGNGAREFKGWYDTALGMNCQVTPGTDFAQRCLPSSLGTDLFTYSDPSCSDGSELVRTFPGQCTNGVIYFNVQDRTCPAHLVLRSIGPEVVPAMVFIRFMGSCASNVIGMGDRFYTPGPEIAPDTFVKLDPLFTGNGRIAAKGWVAEDGARELTQLFDRKHGAGCGVLPADDDVPRCLAYDESVGLELYADPLCSERIDMNTTCNGGNFQIGVADAPCHARNRVAQRGAPFTGSTLYRVGSAGCESVAADPATRYARVGDDIPPASFVRAQSEREPSPDRLVPEWWIVDTFRQRSRWYDTQRDEPCTLEQHGDGSIRCLPTEITGGGEYTDPDCTIPIAPLGCNARYLINFVNSCPFQFRIYTLGSVVTPPSTRYFFDKLQGVCRPQIVQPQPGPYVLGDVEIPAEEFALVNEVIE